MKTKYILPVLFLLFSSGLWAQTTNDFRSLATGNWNALASWERYNGSAWVAATVLPGATANNGAVTIRNGHTITVTAAPTAAISSLTVGEGTSGILNIGGFAITITGATNVLVGGTVNITSATGVKTFTGDVTNAGTWNNSGNSAISFGGNLFHNGTTFTAGSGVQTFSGASKQISGTTSPLAISSMTISGSYQNNVTTLNSSGTVTISGTFTNNTTFNQTGAAAIAGAGSLVNAASANLTISGASITPTLTATATGNTVTYISTSQAQTVKGGTTYVNLTINKSGQVATVGTSAITVNGTLDVTAGTFNDGGFQTVGTASTLLNIANGATIQFGNAGATTSNFPTNLTNANLSLGSTSTVIYNTTSAISISSLPTAYGNLTLSGASTKTLSGAETVQGNLTINAGTLANGGFVLTVNGNSANSGTFSGTGKIQFSGGGASHALSGTGSYTNIELDDAQNLTTSGSFSILGVLTQTSGTFNIGAGTTLTLGAGSSLAATGSGDFGGTTTSNLSIAGTGALGNTLRFASGSQNLGLLTLNRTASGVVNLGSDLTLNASTGLTLTAGLLYLNSYNLTLGATSVTSGGSIVAMVVADGTGELRKTFNTGATGIFTFPIGDVSGTAGTAPNNNNTGADYSPVAFTMTANTVARTIGFRVTDRQHPNDASTTNVISRYWSASDNQTGNGTYTYTATFTYSVSAPSDLTGTQNQTYLNWWDGASWAQLTSTFPTNGFTITGATNSTGKLGGSDFTGRVSPQQTYVWQPTSGSADWQLATNWLPNRISPFASDILQFTMGGSSIATNIPTQSLGQIFVDNNTNISLQPSATASLSLGFTAGTNVLTITAGSTLQLSSTGAVVTTLNFTSSLANLTTNIAGSLTINANTSFNNSLNFTNLTAANNTITGTIQNNGGSITSTAATTTFGSGSFYIHNMNGGIIPTATWNANATLSITGTTTTNPTFSGALSVGYLTWATSGQSATGAITSASSVTVANDLTVTTGTLNLNGVSYNIAGNVSSNGTINSASAGSILNLNGTSAQTVSGTGVWTTGTAGRLLNLTINNAAGVTFSPAVAIQSSLVLTAGALDASALTLGIPTGTVGVTRTLGSLVNVPSFNFSTGVLNLTYNGATTYTVLNELPPSTTPTNGSFAVSAASAYVTLDKNAIVSTISVSNASATLDLNGNSIAIRGITVPFVNSGTVKANASGSTLHLNLTGVGSVSLGGTFTGGIIDNLLVSPSLGVTTFTISAPATNSVNNLTVSGTGGTMGSSLTVNTSLSVSSGTTFSLGSGSYVLSLKGTYSNSGTLTANGSGSTLNFNGTSQQTFAIGTYTASQVTTFTVNNSAGLILSSPVNTTTLNLTSGLVDNGSNTITVTGTTAANVAGGSATAYVKGILARTLPASLLSGSTYTFPIGKSGYNLFELINPTTTAAGTILVTAEALDATAGGTDGIGFSSSPNPARYWQVSRSGAGAFINVGTVRLTDASMSYISTNTIGNSSTLTGVYSPYGGTIAGQTIATNSTVPNSLGFFKIGSKGCLNGTYSVGPTGDFVNLTAAVATLNSSLVCSDVYFELQPTYDGTSGESFPININTVNYTGGPWEVTFRPSAAASARVTSGTSVNQLFYLNGASRITFDGRSGGTGSTINWTFSNTSTAGQVFLFNNDATTDTLQYLTIQGVNVTAIGTASFTNAGIIAFGSSALSTGNESNVIRNCVIKDGASTPSCGIYSLGNTTASRGNDFNKVMDCQFVNIFSATVATYGIDVQNYSSDWTITDNHFYQTASRTSTATVAHTPILIDNSASGNNFTITGNYIGGSTTNAGGTAWTIGGTSQVSFRGISVNILTSGTSLVQNNTIANISINSSNISAFPTNVFTGILSASNGSTSIDDNTVGSPTGNGSILINNVTNTGATVVGIGHNTSSGAVSITNNRVGSFTITSGGSLSVSFNGIRYGQGGSASSRTISDNLIGSLTTSNSINVNTGSTNATAQDVIGINMTTGANAVTITNNTIANLNNNRPTTGNSSIIGINSPFAANTITGNVIRNLSTNANNTGTGTTSSLFGISLSAVAATGHNISNNTIHSLTNSSSSNAVLLHGIYYNPAAGGTNTLDGNLIHSISTASSNGSAAVYGITIASGTATVSNNMIRLGINAAGTSLTNSNLYYGIYETTAANFLHNSVYIGGSGVTTGTSATYAFYSALSSGSRTIQNNIFWNARSNSTGTGKHYAIREGALTGLTCSYNDLYANGTGGVLGSIGGTDVSVLNNISTNSISSDPKFIAPTGDASTVDLHIQVPPAATPIEGTGTASSITIDFDGQTRSGLSPTDIGADAGNFDPIDQTPPSISYTAFANACNSIGSGTYTVSGVTITDASGLNVSSGTKPRIYYKKSTDANDLTGWKYVEAVGTTSPFSFNIDFSLLNAGTINPGDNIQYFVVAQDQGGNVITPNVGINSGTFNSTPASVDLQSSDFPIGGTINSFNVTPCSGTVTVGSGGNYPSLTNTGGIFEAINASTLTGNLTVNILSNLTGETGTVSLNQWNESGAGNYSITFQSSNGTQKQITGPAATGLIRLNGADRVTFNGGTTTQRLLLIQNTSTAAGATTINLAADASNNTFNNCTIEGSTTSVTNGVVSFGTGTTTGNDNNTFSLCDIKENAAGLPAMAIYSVGTAAKENSGNQILDCSISNFFNASTTTPYAGLYLGAGNAAWTIQDNYFFQTATRTVTGAVQPHAVIYINNSTAGTGGYTISGNTIGGNDALGTGTMTYNSAVASHFVPVWLNLPSSPVSTVSGNTIYKIAYQTTSAGTANYGVFTAIYVSGSASGTCNITGNTIGSTTGTGSIAVNVATNSGSVSNGIKFDGTGTTTISGNFIGSISITGTGTNNACIFNAISQTAGNANINTNQIGSATTANSISVSGTATSNATNLYGIVCTASSAYSTTISSNQIYRLTNNNTSSSEVVGGIVTSGGGLYAISGNTVSDLSSSALATGTGTSSSVLGISINTSNTSALSISGNTVYNLRNSGAANTVVTGIYFSGGTNASNAVSKNLVYNLQAGSGASSVITGLHLNGGAVTASNNAIRLGLDASGASITGASIITGISKDNTSANNIYFNSVYIAGGGVTTTANNSYGFRRVQTGVDNIRNNIFVNARSNASTGGKHLGMDLNNTTTTTSNYNILFAPGTGGFLFGTAAGATTYSSLQAYNAATSLDNNSGAASPNFTAPAGLTPDLTLASPSPAESNGINIATITDDINSVSRAANTPEDMGAYVANVTSVDIIKPSIVLGSVTAPNASCTSTATVTITATITDLGSGLATGSLAPVLWWRISTGTWASMSASSVASNVFTYNLSLTGLTAGQVYQYYVAAQDNAGNLAFSNFNSTTPVHSDVNTYSVANANPASFTVTSSSGLSGTVTVGTGGTYTSLTKFDGLFNAITVNGLSGNLTVEIISNTTEDGNQSLNQWTEYCGSNYRVTIKPNAATVRTLTGSLLGMGMFGIYASRVTIDGSYNGSGRYLKFENTYSGTGGSENDVFRFGLSGAITGDTLRNCEVVGNGTKLAGAVVYLYNCNNCVIDNNLIHGGSSNWATNIIRADASNTVTISNNEIYNFLAWSGGLSQRSYGIYIPTGNGSNWTISGNSIFNSGINGQNVQTALEFAPGSSSTGNTISNNWIGGSSAQCGTGGSVTYWGNSYTPFSSSEARTLAMNINAGSITISGNNISNINISSCDYAGFVCIAIGGSTIATVSNNVFGTGTSGNPDSSKKIVCSGGGCSTYGAVPGYIYGIWNTSTTTSTSTYSGNAFYYLHQSGAAAGGNVHCIFHNTSGPATITNNVINGPQSAGGYNQFGIRLEPNASTSGNLIESNSIAGPYINVLANAGANNNGIYVKALSTYTVSGTINKNVVWDMRNADRSGNSEGIFIWSATGGNGNWDITNNQISLKNNGSTSNCLGIYGIDVELNSSSTINVTYNSVYISGANGGTPVTGIDFSSYAFFKLGGASGTAAGGTYNLQNNIFINNRTVGNANVSCHCAIGNVGSSNFATGWNTSDNNFLATNTGTYNKIGQWGTTLTAALSNWQTSSGKDANSYSATYTSGSSNFSSGTLNADNLFVNPLSDLHISLTDNESYKFVDSRASSISIATDFDGDTRTSTPDIGADEFSACILPSAAGTITGTSTVCQGQNSVNFSVPAISNATGYSWTLPTGATIATGNNTNSITVNFSNSATSGNITVKGSNTCGDGTVSANFAVSVNPLPAAAGTITGTATVCQGQNGVSFSVPAISNATGYTWTLPTGATIATGNNTNSITVNFSNSATSGNITVKGTNTCGDGTVSTNFAVTVNPLPAAAGTITGTTTVCQGQNGVSFSVPAISNATGYTWTLPTGATIATGNNTNSITVDFSNSAASGNITVAGTNSCGSGIVSANFAVTVNACNGRTWTGAISTAWNVGGNWLPTIVPTSSDDVIIPNVANDPIVGSYSGYCKNLDIQSGATLSFTGGVALSKLEISGTTISLANTVISGAGVFQVGTASTAVTITGGATFNNDRVEVYAGTTLKLNGSSDFNIGRTIRVNTGANVYSFGSNNTSAYPSSSNATAYLHFTDDGINNGIIDYNGSSATGFILGQVKSDRKIIASNSGYRYISSPVQGNISQWADDFNITGADGFANTGTVFTNPWPTLWLYDETNTNTNMAYGWISYTNTSNTLDRAKGFAAITPGNITIDLTGPLNVPSGIAAGTISKAVTTTSSGQPLSDGWNLLGNPYQAPLGFANLRTANSSALAAYAYYWVSNGTYSGNYASYNALTSLSTNGGTAAIAPHQGFMVRANSNTSIAMNNSMTTSSSAYGFLKDEGPAPDMPIFRLSLKENGKIADEVVVAGHPKATVNQGLDEYDTDKMFNVEQKLSEIYLTESEDVAKKLAVSVLPQITKETVVPMGISHLGVYTVQVSEMTNIPSGVKVYLEDKKLNQYTRLNLGDVVSLTKSEPESAEGRYFLRFGDINEAITAEQAKVIGFTYVEDGNIQIKLMDAGINPSSAKVMDMSGKLIGNFQLETNNGINTINASVLAPGIYLVDVNTDKGRFVNKLILAK